MRRIIFVILSILISLVLLWLVLRDVPLADVWAAMRQADIFWILLSLVGVFLSLITRGIRWRGLLGNRLSLKDSTLILCLSMLLNQLPFRLGEVARTLLAKQRNVPIVMAATSIVVERVLDLFLVVLLVLWSIPQVPSMDEQVSLGAMVFGGIALVIFIALLIAAHFPQVLSAIVNRIENLPLLNRLPLHHLLENLLLGLQTFTDWKRLSHALIWTIIAWASSALILYGLLEALAIRENLILASLLGLGMTSLSIVFPMTVAGIGLIEGALRLMGDFLGYDEIASTALGLLFHGITALGYLVTGIPSAWLLGVSFNHLLKSKPETLDEK